MKKTDHKPLNRGLKRESLRTLVILLLTFACVFGIFQTAVHYKFALIYPIYYFGTGVLFLVFFFVNRGFTRETPLPDQLPEKWDEAKKLDFIESDKRRKRIARKIMLVLVPFLLTIGIDIVWVMLFAKT